MSHNDVATLVRGLPQRTIYDQLYDNQIDYRIFASDFSTVLFFARMRALHQLDKYRLMEDFYKHAHDGTLPPFSMVEPRYFTLPGIPANDMHPSHSVAEGEAFVRDIYNALRSSPTWNETALVITYDEHGGFYDHVPPPEAGVPNPDGINSTDPAIPFAFDRLGVRVPTIVVSPWVARGRLVGEPRESHFDHTSLAATLRKMWKLSGGPLTRRDAWAATFEGIFEELDAARPDSDCPGALAAPEIPRAMLEIETWRDGSLPLNDLQEGMLEFTAMLVGDKTPGDMSKWTEGKAASYIIDATRTWLSKLLGQSN
jgi:phospholipase C